MQAGETVERKLMNSYSGTSRKSPEDKAASYRGILSQRLPERAACWKMGAVAGDSDRHGGNLLIQVLDRPSRSEAHQVLVLFTSEVGV